MQRVDLYQKLEDLVPTCRRCRKPQFAIIGRFSTGKPTQWKLNFCSLKDCTMHCQCYAK